MTQMHSSYLPRMSRALRRVNAKLRHISNAPDRFVEVPVAASGRPVPGAHVPGRNEAALDEPAINFSDDPGYYAEEASYSAAGLRLREVAAEQRDAGP